MSRSDRRRAALARHAAAEREALALRPWATLPVEADGEPPESGDDSMRALTWHRARDLRDELLRKNPRHYDDTDHEDDGGDDEPDEPLPRAAWAPDGSGWMQDPDRKGK
jgi:hypothetical protein